MVESEITSLKEALGNQYITMQKLYYELEEEREASATAASEALSMILRLQGEKAVEKMEACQYKRMAEEKMHHAEESLAIFEELLYQKEMEIASLKFQVQAYRDKLSNTGVSDPILSEMKILGVPYLSRTNAFISNMSFHGNVRRNISLPVMRFTELCSEMDNIDEEVPSTAKGHSIPENFNDFTNNMKEESGQENAGGLRVEELHKTVKETTNKRNVEEKFITECILADNELQTTMPVDTKSSRVECRSCSWNSAVSSDTVYDSTIGVTETKLSAEGVSSSCSQSEDPEYMPDFDTLSSSYLESESLGNTIHIASVHDIFEVPQGQNGCHSEPQNKLLPDSILEEKNVLSTTESMPNETRDYYLKDDELLKKALLCTNRDTRLSTTGGFGMNYHWAFKDPKFGTTPPQIDAEQLWQTDIEQLKKRLQLIEDDRRIMKQEASDIGKELLKYLREISEQLSMIHSQIKKPQFKKYPPQDDPLVVSAMEAMLYFSI